MSIIVVYTCFMYFLAYEVCVNSSKSICIQAVFIAVCSVCSVCMCMCVCLPVEI